MNRTTLVGNITKDLELKMTATGVSVCSFTVAVNRTFSNANGERETDFVNCVVWRKQAENLAKFCGKGSTIGVDGRIQTRNYEKQDGTRQFITEVVAEQITFINTKKGGNNNQEFAQPQDGGFNQGNGFGG